EHDLGKTVIGNGNFFMAYVHIAHDCVVEDGVIIANGVQIGGHCRIEKYSNFGGLAALHHFVTVGSYSFVGGLTRIVRDVPPYMIVEGNPAEVRSVNSVGLRRRGFSSEKISLLKRAFRILFHQRVPMSVAIGEVESSLEMSDEIKYLLASLRETMKSKTGRAREITRWKEKED
ncbi:MAG: acyl-[acyl-carrier-protein]--UDP-N-acetylglucosamine O-acyltransferase, partial [Planctomycetota bacterium]|nr:acyl-[acyl-carrier-protein]--UDP-N-acetylglucosamine O-acyltransferase [Planctomycetota bacterium]